MSEEVRSLLVGFRKNYKASIVGKLNCILSKISVEIFVNLGPAVESGVSNKPGLKFNPYTTRRQRRRENGVDMASYFHIWMVPRHFHVVFDVASCLLNLSIS